MALSKVFKKIVGLNSGIVREASNFKSSAKFIQLRLVIGVVFSRVSENPASMEARASRFQR